MGILSISLNGLGLILLSHAVYSAHEHTALLSAVKPVTSSSGLASAPHAELPLDIIIETLVAAFLLCVGIVVGAPGLKPIQWREWAGKLEREGVREDQKLEDRTRNPYRVLEDRQGFLDVRGKKKAFADWVREGGQG